MSHTARVVTAAELERYTDDHRYELVQGRVIRMSPVGYRHGTTVMRVGFLLGRYLENHSVGAIMTEVGFKLASAPDTVRAPDIAFVRRERIPADVRGFIDGAPDLAVEVLSPDDRPAEVQGKVAEYLACGAQLVVAIDADRRTVTTYAPGASPAIVGNGDQVLDLSAVLPGFSCRLSESFD